MSAESAGGATVLATPIATGAWTLPAVPAGPYTLAVVWKTGDTSFFHTGASAIDLGRDVGGRSDVARATSATPVTLQLQNLSPWVMGDRLQIYAWDADLWDEFTPTSLAAAATSTSSEILDFYSDAKSTVSQAKSLLVSSDAVYLVQYRSGLAAGTSDSYRQAVSWAVTGGVAMSSGSATTLAATFQSVNASDGMAVDWKTSQFEPLLSGLQHPYHRLSVLAVPVALELPSPFFSSVSMNLMDLYLSASSPVTDRSYGALSFGTFLPANYREVRLARFYGLVARFAPGAQTGRWFEEVVGRFDGPPFTGPIVPLVGPARSPTVSARDALLPQTGVGATPVLSWSAPSLGSPTRYRVQLVHLYVPTGQTTTATSLVATFYTAAPQVTVPAGILTLGQTYVATIESVSLPGDAVETAPYRSGVPQGHASITTQAFVP